MEKINRILFRDNPYPRGHLIKKINWSGRLDAERGLVFDFHLESEAYENSAAPETGEEPEEEVRDWYSRDVWANYNGCILSSTAWGSSGIVVARPGELFSFSSQFPLRIKADTLPLPDEVDWDDLAIGLYLLGHDACADHNIHITRTGANRYDLHWTGKIALAYVGEVDFNYDFEIHLYEVPFDGIHYPQHWSRDEAMAALGKVVDDPDVFTFEDLNPKSNKRTYKLVRNT